MSKIILQLSHVRKEFLNGTKGSSPKVAVKDSSFSLFEGEVFGLVGESGSGKSTLARCAFGVIPVTSGSVSIFGQEITGTRPSQMLALRKEMGFVFQDPIASLNPKRSVHAIVSEGLIGTGMDRNEIDSRVKYLVERVGLSQAHLDRRRHELSGGQCQRVAIARALAPAPKLLLLDEPTSSLDLSVQAQILNLLEELRAELSLSYLLISHNLDVIAHLSDRMAVMHEGMILEEGTTQSVITTPAHLFTRELILAYSYTPKKDLPANFSLDHWQDAPLNRWAYQNVPKFIDTRTIETPEFISQLPIKKTLLLNAHEQSEIENLYTDALIVVKSGVIYLEQYSNGMIADSTHLLQSVSKSILGLLVGALIERGAINPKSLVAEILPEMSESGYAGASIQNLMDMTAAIIFSEDYEDSNSEIAQLDRASGWRHSLDAEPVGIHEFLKSLKKHSEHGLQFQYCSANTDLLAWIATRVTGKSYENLLSEFIWSPIGASTVANITVDRFGAPLANGGISATAIDAARFGIAVLSALAGTSGGFSTEQVQNIFEGAAKEIKSVDYIQRLHPGGGYHNQWWITNSERREIYAVGIFGQYIWIDPAADAVIVKFSTLPIAVNAEHSDRHVALFRSICKKLN